MKELEKKWGKIEFEETEKKPERWEDLKDLKRVQKNRKGK